MITQSGDLRQPVQLEKQLMEDDSMEKEVGMAMVQLLRVSSKGWLWWRHAAGKHGRGTHIAAAGECGSALTAWQAVREVVLQVLAGAAEAVVQAMVQQLWVRPGGGGGLATHTVGVHAGGYTGG